MTGAGASSLDGALKATGSFYLTNPQGVVVGPSGIATKGGFFVASTLDVDDSAFMAGNGKLQLTGTSEAAVVDLLAIGSSGGDVMLISRAMTLNASSIDASKGTIELVNGNAALIQDSTTTRQVYVQAGAQGDVVDAGSMPFPPDDVRGVTTVADKRNVPGPASAADTASGLVADDVPRSRSPGDAPSRSTGRQSRASCHHFGFNDVPDASTADRSNAEQFDYGESGSGIHWFIHCRLGGRTSVRDPLPTVGSSRFQQQVSEWNGHTAAEGHLHIDHLAHHHFFRF